MNVLMSFIVYGLLPFLLIYVVIFAILQKSKILGDGKPQIDAIVAIVLALILVSMPGPQRDIIIFMVPWISVGLVVLLAFFLLYGFVAGDLSSLPNWMKIVAGVLSFIFITFLVVYATGFDYMLMSWTGGYLLEYFISTLIFLAVIGAVAWVFFSSKNS